MKPEVYEDEKGWIHVKTGAICENLVINIAEQF